MLRQPDLSLVIATLDDDGDLRLCLESLARQAAPPTFEVIVIDQNAHDEVAALVARFASRLSIRHEKVAFRNASQARNFGVGLARGEWVGFPDDDCQLLPDALAAAAPLLKRKELQLVTGRTVDAKGRPSVLRWKPTAGPFGPSGMFGRLTCATLFVRRSSFLDAGGFDPRFGPGGPFPSAEEFDLATRLFERPEAGTAWYAPAIRMQHPDKVPPWTRWAARRMHDYAFGAGAWVAKHRQPRHFVWLARTLVASTVQSLSLPPWRSASYLMRLWGVLRGYLAFRASVRRG